jgi:hypothetical protein
VLDFARKKKGDVLLASILWNLKIPSEFLSRPDEKVSITLLSDILKFLFERGFTFHDFVQMGWHSVSINENQEIGKNFHGLSERQVFEKLFDEVILKYEENFDYRIVQAGSDFVKVQPRPKEVRIEDFKSEQIDNLFVSFYRHGACAAHLKHAGHEIARSEFLSSTHLGASAEEFILSW